MKRYAYGLTVWFLLIAAALNSPSAAQRTSTRQARLNAFPAKQGFYIQLWMCHACAYYGWQKDTVSALGKAAVQAFVSDDPNSGYHQTEQRYFDLQALRLRRVIASRRATEDWSTPVYAGPFDSEQTARQVFSQLTSSLTPILEEIDKSGSRELTDCSGNHCQLSRYTVQLIRVTSVFGQSLRSQDAELNIGTIDNTDIYSDVINWCFFKSPSAGKNSKDIFFVNVDETPYIFWLNIDGHLTALKLVSSAPKNLQRLTKGSSFSQRYRSGDITAHITYVVVKKYPEGADYTATVVVTKGNRSKTVKTACECG